MATEDKDRLFIDTLRFLAADAVEKAGSGHPGMPMGAAPMAHVLWSRFLRHNPTNPEWPDRDRFVLSAGHGSALLYGLLYLNGYDLPLDQIERLRQWDSMTPGHPERRRTPGVEVTTGPLGQGFGMAVGLALAERLLAARFNTPEHTVVDHFTYVIASDGDLMEGISYEASSLAGHLGLGKLICLYDENRVTIDGSADLAFSDQIARRFSALGWHVQLVRNGNDLDAIERSIRSAREFVNRPSLIRVKTHIGYGSPKQDSAEAHGKPLGPDALREAKERLGWPTDEPFHVPEVVAGAWRDVVAHGVELEGRWRDVMADYRKTSPELAIELDRRLRDARPPDWRARLETFADDDSPMATRDASQRVLNMLEESLPELVGGSADLASSTKTTLEDERDFRPGRPGRNIHFGVREHAMGAATNGMALHGGLRPYAGTFLIFSDYMRPAVRLAALMRSPSVFVFSHDSIGLGGDGPTHQPVEHLASLRAMPNIRVIRPADANETEVAWSIALEHPNPTALVLTRQEVPILPMVEDGRDGDVDGVRPAGVRRGAYVIAGNGAAPDVVLLATGSEVHVALDARERLRTEGVHARVVSMPCWEIFAEQPQSYRDEVIPPDVRARVAVEAAAPLGWERWAGDEGLILGVRRFGASAPGDEVMHHFGFTPEIVADIALSAIERTNGALAQEVAS